MLPWVTQCFGPERFARVFKIIFETWGGKKGSKIEKKKKTWKIKINETLNKCLQSVIILSNMQPQFSSDS